MFYRTPVHLHHLALRTGDVARLERFYTEVFDLTELRRDGCRSVWLDAAGVIVMIERREDDEPLIDARSLELTCFALAAGDYEALLGRLTSASIAIEARTPSTVYFRDPDGRRVGASVYPAMLPISANR